tara:strand:- start:1315 stop:2595 length:1281 start_codon:yes stop_codon:yes gene_type:complete
MAKYSTTIQTKYLDPVSHSNSRTVFRLPNDEQYYPNFKLSDLGVLTDADTTYTKGGIYGMIRSIAIYSGQEQIDRLEDVSRYANFKNRLNTNSSNKDINKYNNRSGLGYEIDMAQQITHVRAANSVNATIVPHNLGLIQLSDVLPVLRNLSLWDTSKLQNSSLVIEWNSDVINFLQDTSKTVASVVRPVLICDNITGSPDVKALNTIQSNVVQFNSIVHDVVQLPAVDISSLDAAALGTKITQPIQQKLGSLRTRVVQDVVMIKEFSDRALSLDGTNVIGDGVLRSPVMINENVNFRVNGQPIFTSPIVYDSTKSQLVQEIFGPINRQPYENEISIGLDNPKNTTTAVENNFIGIPSNRDQVGMNSLMAVKLNNRVNTFEVEYSRDCYHDTLAKKIYSAGINLHFFASVGKVIQFSNNSFTVQYLT